MAAAASLVAIAVLWPAPTRDPLRAPAVDRLPGARRAAARPRPRYVLGGGGRAGRRAATRAVAAADAARRPRCTRRSSRRPYRPTGLSTPARTIVRLVDDLNWLNAIVAGPAAARDAARSAAPTCAVKVAAAAALERGADLLETPAATARRSCARRSASCDGALDAMERSATVELPIGRSRARRRRERRSA